MKRGITSILVLSLALIATHLSAPSSRGSAQNYAGSKVLLVVLESAESPAGYRKVLKALDWAAQLHKSAIQTVLVFDGLGAQWLIYLEGLPAASHADWKDRLSEGQRRRLGRLMADLKATGLSPVVTRTAAAGSNMAPDLEARGVKTARLDGRGELDIIQYVNEGFQVWIF